MHTRWFGFGAGVVAFNVALELRLDTGLAGNFLATAATPTEPDPPWIAVMSVVIAGIALVLSVLSTRTARRSLRIAERQEARREPRLDLYLHESLVFQRPNPVTRALGFHIQVANPTDSDNSISDAELLILYTIDASVMTVRVRPYSQADPTDSSSSRKSLLRLPSRIPAHDAVSGWLVFHVPDALTSGHRIDRYELSVREVHGQSVSLQTTVIPEDVNVIPEVDESED